MIDPATRLAGTRLDLSTRPDRQATFRQPGDQQATTRQSAGQPTAAVAAGAETASAVEASGLKLSARLVPAGQHGHFRATGLPVEVRLLDPATGGAAAGRAAGLLATVIGPSAERGLVLDLGGHRLSLPPGAVELPIGATLTIQLQLPGSSVVVGEQGALDRLISAWLDRGPKVPAGPQPAAGHSPPSAPDAGLAARLLADWRTLAGRTPGTATPAGEVTGKRPSSLELRIDGDTGRSLLVDRDSGWRVLFGLLGEPKEPAQPVSLWRRERGADAPDDDARRLLLTLDLSRFGRVVLQLETGPGRLRLAIASAEPLPQPLRADIAEAFRAAAELGGLAPALAFRAAPAAAVPLHDDRCDHLADWVG